MAQVDVRLSRKLYKTGERTDAMIILKIHMDSACTCGALEMTMKLVNRIKLVTPHIVRATNMRMIICFMTFLLQPATFQYLNRSTDFASRKSRLSTKNTHLPAILFRECISNLTDLKGPLHFYTGFP
jgi:hypothetical protein